MKTKYILLFLSILASLLVAFRLPGLLPSEFLASLIAKTNAFTEKIPSEKVYLHTDKTFFKPGEDIWFRAYLVNGTNHTADAASHVVYVDLINPRGSVDRTLTLLATNGDLHGDFHLDESAPGGLYKLRAYTQWMKNVGEEYFFQKEIQVQKVLTPRLLLKIDFERKAYGPGDQVMAELEIKDLKNNPLVRQSVTYTIQIAGVRYLQAHAVTNTSGKASIRFSLPDTLQTTDGLLNIITEYEGNPESISRSIPIVLNKIAVQFFPEGGDMVANVSSRVAFKALNEFGKPADVEGYLTDNTGQHIRQVKSYHQGMGVVEFTPQLHQTYQLHLTKPATHEVYTLPPALAKGYTLAIDTVDQQRIQVTFHSPVARTAYLVAQVRGTIYFTKEIDARIGRNTLDIPTREFPIGIAQVTLFDHNQIPRCERLTFVNAHRQLRIVMTTDKKQYAPREQVELTIQTMDEDSLPVPAQLSVSVADDRLLTFADDKQDNILSYLLMSSDLKGTIEEPSFYFKPDEPKATRALDYVLMTHGWRRFTWQQIADGPPTPVYLPETMGSLSGTILDAKTFQPITATVTLFELEGKRRSAQLETGASGRFTFQQVNPKMPMQVFAQAGSLAPTHILIRLDQEYEYTNHTSAASQPARADDFAWQREVLKERVRTTQPPVQSGKAVPDSPVKPASTEAEEGMSLGDMSLTPDIQSLSEVVVVGYTTQEKKDVTGSVTVVTNKEISSLPPRNLESTLQGRIAGVEITQSDAAAGSAASVHIRGSGSIVNGSPLYVVDGVPVDNPGMIAPADIESITVIKSGQAAALYGSRGSQGVIDITTKKRDYYSRFIPRNKLPMSQVYVKERKFSQVREFYAPVYKARQPVAERTDFRSTIYWNPSVTTDARTGTARLHFCNSDQVTSFRVITEGLSTHGLAGRAETTYATQLPFSIEARIPPYLTFEDRVAIPISLKNTTQQPIHGTLTVRAPQQLKITTFDGSVYSLPGEAKTLYLYAEVQAVAGKGTLQLLFEGNGFQETIAQEIEVQPKGFPTEIAYSGKEKDAQFSFDIPDPVKGSLKAELKAYPNILSGILDGIESIIREPHGCFEQTSSYTYPNILVLDYLQKTQTVEKRIRSLAHTYIEQGYKRLIGFETSKGGFEWFGHTPAHLGLTAMGLMEFTEMQQVYTGVDQTMLTRTRRWLLNKRDGQGNFTSDNTHYSYRNQYQKITNAYVVYALSEINETDIQKEYSQAYEEAFASKDLYRMALLANASFNRKETSKGNSLLDILATELARPGWATALKDGSILGSYGKSLEVETLSLTALAMLKSNTPDISALQAILKQIIASRVYGGFGSTQATILSLKALTQFDLYSRHTAESGNILVYLGSELVGSQTYEKDRQGEIVIAGLEKHMSAGHQPFRVFFENARDALPYSVNVSWHSRTPASADQCKVSLETSLAAGTIKSGQTVRLTTLLRNKTHQTQPMTVALIGIPSGVSAQPWQLKELQEKKLVDFYEVRKNYIVFYYRNLAPDAIHTLHLDLKADVPGVYQAPASTAYLYYTNEFKHWEAGEKVTIEK